MRGNVIGFDADINTGAISGHDGRRYDFVRLDWRGPGVPRRGDLVDFQAIDQRATEIYLVESAYVSPTAADFYFSPKGRISRKQYWLRFMLPYIAIYVVLQVAADLAGQGTASNIAISLILALFSLVALWPSIAVLVKRIHDRDKSGWLVLALLIPGLLFAILLLALVGTAALAVAGGQAEAEIPALGALGVIVIILGVGVLGIDIWFFVEFGCLRGTIGPNRFGPDPIR